MECTLATGETCSFNEVTFFVVVSFFFSFFSMTI